MTPNRNDQYITSTNLLLDSINLKIISKIQRYLEPCEITSLLFLLDNDPKSTFKKLSTNNHADLVHQWATGAQLRNSWKLEFLEALCTCQLYTIIRKLGCHVPTVKAYFTRNSEDSIYIHPLKKILYKLCEQMTTKMFNTFKHRVSLEYNINFKDPQVCELLFLQLMAKELLILDTNNENIKKNYSPSMHKLINTISKISELRHLCCEFESYTMSNKAISSIMYSKLESVSENYLNKLHDITQGKHIHKQENGDIDGTRIYMNDFQDTFSLIEVSCELANIKLKTDADQTFQNYPIKN